jgi:hypothetical protein
MRDGRVVRVRILWPVRLLRLKIFLKRDAREEAPHLSIGIDDISR